MAPWDGADHWEELELDAAMEQSGIQHTLSEEVSPVLLSTLLPPAKAPKCPSKPSHSHQDEMLCHRRFRVLSACRRRHVLDPLWLHRCTRGPQSRPIDSINNSIKVIVQQLCSTHTY
jgi:hypothetical protein